MLIVKLYLRFHLPFQYIPGLGFHVDFYIKSTDAFDLIAKEAHIPELRLLSFLLLIDMVILCVSASISLFFWGQVSGPLRSSIGKWLAVSKEMWWKCHFKEDILKPTHGDLLSSLTNGLASLVEIFLHYPGSLSDKNRAPCQPVLDL